jgi:hypothetical protein
MVHFDPAIDYPKEGDGITLRAKIKIHTDRLNNDDGLSSSYITVFFILSKTQSGYCKRTYFAR